MSRCLSSLAFGLVLALMLAGFSQADDSVEFLNGTMMNGTVLEIRSEAKEFDFQSTIGQQQITRTYPYNQVHAVTFNGKRFVITPKPDVGTKLAPGGKEMNAAKARAVDSVDAGSRTKAQVLAVIDESGRKPPDWFASTTTNHPATLDLSWPLKADGPWNASINVGQYIWDRINPNEDRWRPGIKLVHDCMAQHQGEPDLLARDIDKLGEMYFSLLQDYARAAFWFQQVNIPINRPQRVHLAECYWRLGNKEMALAKLKGNSLHFDAIKLLGDMGEVESALKVSESFAGTNQFNEAFINAGDALRSAGRLDEAIAYYQRVLDLDQARNPEYKMRFHARAEGAIEAIKLFDKADINKVSDGTYIDSSTGYNGKLEVQVHVANSKVEMVNVTTHQEKQFYAALTDTTQQIIEKQSIRDIDGTSGATITSQAIIHATARALAQGAK